jgi:hypothetical protein
MAVLQDAQAVYPRDRNSLRRDNGFASESQPFPVQIPARSLFDRLRDYPILLYARLRVKLVFFPQIKWFKDPPTSPTVPQTRD